WLPPAYKATSGGLSVGYDAYDLYDLGEFDQKGSVATKYGTKEEYLQAIAALKEVNISAIADVVFNHKAGADELERVKVRRVNPDNRLEFQSDAFDIDAWTKFTFPGRAEKYSAFVWDHQCFSGIDRAEDLQQDGIFSIQNEYGESWEEVPSNEFGNYDYLMFNDIETRNVAVRDELKRWGEWYYETCGMDGFRLDAVKHISVDFLNEWLDHLKNKYQRPFFFIAENWIIDSVEEMDAYVKQTAGRVQLFDSILHHNFYLASRQENYDLAQIFEGTLVSMHPELSITFVDNHDSQPLQALSSYVDFWFRPLAYALILLREQGIPCLFYPDLYGCTYTDDDDQGNQTTIELVALDVLPLLCQLRMEKAEGMQRDYFDHNCCIGWTREGVDEVPGSGLAVVLSNGDEGFKDMEMGHRHAGKTFVDALGHCKEEVLVNDHGWARFHCEGKSVSVWVLK
uniref:alpha-amylase n=1 Tax=Pedobacter sp. TaxID=1411316 RepID=UPI003D7FC67D